MRDLKSVAARAHLRTPWLWRAGWIALGLSIPIYVLTMLDARVIDGVNVWTKPWKFHVSVGIHLLTLAICATLLSSDKPRHLWWLTTAVLASTVFELIYITARAAMALPSHFDVSSPFTSTMYTLMGIGAVTMTGCAGLLGIWIVRDRQFAFGPIVKWGVGGGLILGAVLGTLSGIAISGNNGHAVGGAQSDALGSWLFNWSRDGGDLRVAHFFGLHALQIIPLASWLIAQQLRASIAPTVLACLAAGYVALVLTTLIQAFSGLPFAASIL